MQHKYLTWSIADVYIKQTKILMANGTVAKLFLGWTVHCYAKKGTSLRTWSVDSTWHTLKVCSDLNFGAITYHVHATTRISMQTHGTTCCNKNWTKRGKMFKFKSEYTSILLLTPSVYRRQAHNVDLTSSHAFTYTVYASIQNWLTQNQIFRKRVAFTTHISHTVFHEWFCFATTMRL